MSSEFNSEEDYLEMLYEAHLDGECSEFLRFSDYCTYCDLERMRRAFEDRIAKERNKS